MVDVGLEHRQLPTQDVELRVVVVENLGVAEQLRRGVVGGRDAERRVLLADRLPGRRHICPVARDGQQHGRALRERRPDRVGPSQVQQHVRHLGCADVDWAVVEHVLRWYDDRHVPCAGGDQVAEALRPDEGNNLSRVARGVPRVDEHPPSVTPPAVSAVTPPQQPESERQGQQA